MSALNLYPHPSLPSHQTQKVEFFLERVGTHRLWLRYMIWGPLAVLTLPAPAEGRRADNLWRTTCLELFARDNYGDIYFEFNFSPSTEWAAYRFSGYRAEQTDLFMAAAPQIDLSFRDDLFDMEVTLDLELGEDATLAPAAIVEETDGTMSYWALAHPPGNPDFHNQAYFTLNLPPAPPTSSPRT